MKFFLSLFIFLISIQLPAQVIRIDGSFDDWGDISPIFTDALGDGQSNGIDIERVWIHNDQDYLYFRFELNREINLQEDNELAIYIDFDDDINTGFKINGIGAEVRYFFGDRLGIISKNGFDEFTNFVPLDMVTAPTVTGSEFEVSIARRINDSGISLTAGPEITFRIEDNGFSGDEIPDDLFGVDYEIDNTINAPKPDFILSRPENTDFRFLTYNIENDQLFDASRRNNFRRILQAIDPDIIAFQEIRDFSSTQTRDLVDDFLPGNWFHKKHGFDIVTLSRYPITFSENINGNAAFFIDVDGREILLVNSHLPCCDNNTDRQAEVDGIMEYIRDAKDGETNYLLEEDTPIIIAGDMNFVGDNNQPYTFITGDIFANGTYGPDYSPDWDDTNLHDADPNATGIHHNYTWYNPFGSFLPGKLDWIIYTDSQMKIENSYTLWTDDLSTSEQSQYSLNRQDVVSASDHLPVVADFNFSTVSTDEFVEINIETYPNPVTDKIYITKHEELFGDISILTSEGIKVKISENDSSKIQSIDVLELPAGRYYLIFQTRRGRSAKSFVKI